jgi:mono/diheme cytochrome c family protein
MSRVARHIASLAALGILILISATGARAQTIHGLPQIGRGADTKPNTRVGRANAGKPEYTRYCAGCHGDRGDGMGENTQWIDPKPRDFTQATFKCRSTPSGSLPTDQDIINTMRRGIVNSNMPQWRPLTDQTQADILAYIKTFSPRWKTEKPGTPIEIPPETPVTTESILAGRAMYQKFECWKCHGAEGRGDGPSASSLTDNKDQPIHPYDFTTGTRFKCGTTNADLYRIFMTGLDGTPMASFADNIKGDQGWDLVHYLRTLQPVRTPESALWKTWLATHAGELKPIGPPESGGN